MRLFVLVCGLLAAPASGGGESGAAKRYAIIIGANIGNPGEGVLQYATADARNVASTLESVAGFAREHMVVLSNPTASEVRARFKAMDWAMKADSAVEKLLLVYYSGHADIFSIHLGNTAISWLELTSLTTNVDAKTRILLVDACRSGELTQVKGSLLEQPFALPRKSAPLPQGIAVITSASAGEQAQESPAFHGSFFTHHFLVALRGAGDQNGDGQVTLDEAFNYSSTQALFDTAKTVVGPQHATYKLKMRGRGGLALASPKSSIGLATLHISDQGDYLLRGGRKDAPYVLEMHVAAQSESSVWLAPGEYEVQRRTSDGIYAGPLTLKPRLLTRLKVSNLTAQDLPLYAQKGGAPPGTVEQPRVSLRLFGIGGSAMLSQQSLPWGAGLTLAAKVQKRLWIEFLAEGIAARGVSGPWHVNQQVANIAAGLRVAILQRSRLSWYGGAKTGAALFLQQYEGAPALASRYQVASVTEASTSVEVTLSAPVLLTLEIGPRLVYLNLLQSDGESHHHARISGWLRLGVAFIF